MTTQREMDKRLQLWQEDESAVLELIPGHNAFSEAQDMTQTSSTEYQREAFSWLAKRMTADEMADLLRIDREEALRWDREGLPALSGKQSIWLLGAYREQYDAAKERRERLAYATAMRDA